MSTLGNLLDGYLSVANFGSASDGGTLSNELDVCVVIRADLCPNNPCLSSKLTTEALSRIEDNDYPEVSRQRISTSSPGPGVIPERIRVSPADCSRAMSYDTPPGTSMGTSQASTLAAI